MARWFQWAWLSKIRFCSFPRSIAIITARWAPLAGVITRSGRDTRSIQSAGQARAHTPHPRQISSLTLAFFMAGRWGSWAEIIVIASTCLLYTSDAADDLLCVDLGGRRIIKKKKK